MIGIRNVPMHADIPTLLATKLLPDMEQQEAALKQLVPGGDVMMTSHPEEALATAEMTLEGLKEAVGYLTTAILGDDGSGVLDSKVRL